MMSRILRTLIPSVQGVFCLSMLIILSGCSGRSDKYDGEVEDVAVVVEHPNGAEITYHLGQAAGMVPPGKLTVVKLRLKQFPKKEFSIPQELAVNARLISLDNFPQSGFAVSVEELHVQIRCKKGSTIVLSMSTLNK